MADPRIDRRLREPLPFHLGLPLLDVSWRDRRRVFAREAEEGEHGVRLVALDVMAAQARSARGGVGPEGDGIGERGCRFADNSMKFFTIFSEVLIVARSFPLAIRRDVD